MTEAERRRQLADVCDAALQCVDAARAPGRTFCAHTIAGGCGATGVGDELRQCRRLRLLLLWRTPRSNRRIERAD
jgi:hypothetical protein